MKNSPISRDNKNIFNTTVEQNKKNKNDYPIYTAPNPLKDYRNFKGSYRDYSGKR